MKKKPVLDREASFTLIIALLGFLILTTITSCGTTSIYGCTELIGPDHDKCMEDYAVRDGIERRREMMNPR